LYSEDEVNDGPLAEAIRADICGALLRMTASVSVLREWVGNRKNFFCTQVDPVTWIGQRSPADAKP
jgi:hypothetical protein